MDLYIDLTKNTRDGEITCSVAGFCGITKYKTDDVADIVEFIYHRAQVLGANTCYIDSSGMESTIMLSLRARGLKVKHIKTFEQGVATSKTQLSNASEPNKRIILSRGNLFEIVATISSDTNKRLRGVCLSGGGDISFEDVDGTYYQLSTKDVDTITVKDLK